MSRALPRAHIKIWFIEYCSIQQSCAHVVVYNILYIIGGAATNAGDDCEHVTSGITDVVRQYVFFVRAVVFVSDVPANRQSESCINCSCKHCACACSVCTCFNCTAIHRERQGVCVHGRERLHCNDLMYRFPGYGWLSHPHTHRAEFVREPVHSSPI